jgi:hypothetical protein
LTIEKVIRDVIEGGRIKTENRIKTRHTVLLDLLQEGAAK